MAKSKSTKYTRGRAVKERSMHISIKEPDPRVPGDVVAQVRQGALAQADPDPRQVLSLNHSK